MKTITIILIFCTCFKLHAQQNLVPNPSFEEYLRCPVGNASTMDSNSNNFLTVKNWFVRNLSSPDYYNSCATGIRYNVPYNSVGYQVPRSGSAYLGVLLYYGKMEKLNNTTVIQREYVTNQLSSMLTKDSSYYVVFYVSPSDNGLFNTSSYYGFTTSIGVVFSSTLFYQPNSSNINTPPQIQNPLNRFLTDTQNWIKVSGVFKAKGGEQYLTIGNFLDNINTPIKLIHSNPIDSNKTFLSFYYIDDVNVVQLPFKSNSHM